MKAKLFTVLILSFLLGVAGCKKDDPVPPDPPTPSDSTLTVTLNGVKVAGIYAVQFEAENLIILKWNYTGKVITVLRDGNFFSNKTVGDTTMRLENSMTFTFLDTNGNPLPPKIGISIKTEIVLPQIISFTASASSVTRGDSVILSLIYSNGDTNLITSSPLVLKSLSTDSVRNLVDYPMVSTRYTAVVWNQYGSDTATVDVVVTEPTRADSLFGSWLTIDKLYQAPGSTQFVSLLVDCEKDDYTIFMANYRFEYHQGPVWCGGTSELFANGDWSLSEDGTQLNIAGLVHNIIELTDTTLVMTCPDLGSVGGIHKIIYNRIL